jgi:hypothetical protein
MNGYIAAAPRAESEQNSDRAQATYRLPVIHNALYFQEEE